MSSIQAKKKSVLVWGRRTVSRVSTWFACNIIALSLLLAVHFYTAVASQKWWADSFAVLTNLLAGGLVSFLFYFLVVVIPERRRRGIVKANLLQIYRNIKEDMLASVVQASIKGGRTDLSGYHEEIIELMSPVAFKEAFSHGREADEGFYAFENQMKYDTDEYRRIVLNLEMLAKQIEFLLHNYSIDDQGLFNFFKRLEIVLRRLQTNGPGYDEAKPLCRFIWEIYAGWNWDDEYTGKDRVEEMISSL